MVVRNKDNVLSFEIPHQRVADKVAKRFGYQCQDHVLTSRLKNLLELRERRIISIGELEEMCTELVNSSVSKGINKGYVYELKSLLQKHHSEAIESGIEDELQGIYLLMEKYEQ